MERWSSLWQNVKAKTTIENQALYFKCHHIDFFFFFF